MKMGLKRDKMHYEKRATGEKRRLDTLFGHFKLFPFLCFLFQSQKSGNWPQNKKSLILSI